MQRDKNVLQQIERGLKESYQITFFFKQNVRKKFEKSKTVNFVERGLKESTNGMIGPKRNLKFRKR